MERVQRMVGLTLIAAGLAIAQSAGAAEIVDVVTGGPTDIVVGTPYPFTHDLSGNEFAAGTITSANLEIVLTDDKGNESYTISFGTVPQAYAFTLDNINGNTDFNFSVLAQSLADLSATGKLDVTISATDCNGKESRCDSYAFKFVSSRLTATTMEQPQVRQPTNAVPEPGTVALLGLGLAGISALRRRVPNRLNPRA